MTPSAITPEMIRREISFSMIDPDLERMIETAKYGGKDPDGKDVWSIDGAPYHLTDFHYAPKGVAEILYAIRQIMGEYNVLTKTCR